MTTTTTMAVVEEHGETPDSYEIQVERAKENLNRLDKEMQRLTKEHHEASNLVTRLILSRHAGMKGIFDHVPTTLDSFLTEQELVLCIMTCKSWYGTITKRDDTYKKFLYWKCGSGGMDRMEEGMKLESITNYKQAMNHILKNAKKRRILHPITLDRETLDVDPWITHGWSHFDNGRSHFNEETTLRNFWKHGYKEIARDARFITLEAEPLWTFVQRNLIHHFHYHILRWPYVN
jgi:hypothetical protein